ncbi:hypothetical protein RF55_15025 [Lasius niger]|uniref:BED-type domain-containing protein n=1 Tax=Lasius niger TaxID=67767 RepID=A0A0J7N0C4_LASNI|nr:hypothetical protein RF55_15025 [Lasius niger]
MNSEESKDDSQSKSLESEQLKTKKQKMKYDQKYKKEWQMEEAFGKWLQSDKENKCGAYCKVCNKTIKVRAGKIQLYKHMETAMHQRLSKSTKKQVNLPDITKTLVNQDGFKKRADLYLAAYVAEHNLSFNSVNHLPSLIEAICPEYENGKKFNAIVPNAQH